MLPISKIQDDIIIDENTNEVQHETINNLSIQQEMQKPKYLNIYSLEQGTEEDRFRLSLFFRLLERFTDRVDDELPNMKAKYPSIYSDNCTQLYAFNLDFETLENHEWMKMNFPTIKKMFYKENFSRTIRTKYLVTNVVRHMVHWLNEHYQFLQPITYHNIELLWGKTGTKQKKLRTMSFISFDSQKE